MSSQDESLTTSIDFEDQEPLLQEDQNSSSLDLPSVPIIDDECGLPGVMNSPDSIDPQERLNSLLQEFATNRNALFQLIQELDHTKRRIDLLFPDRPDFRNSMVYTERVKSLSELFRVLLEIRKEISRSLKDEFEMVRKVGQNGPGTGLLEEEQIYELIEAVDSAMQVRRKISLSKTSPSNPPTSQQEE
jgi:hypothetical protein